MLGLAEQDLCYVLTSQKNLCNVPSRVARFGQNWYYRGIERYTVFLDLKKNECFANKQRRLARNEMS
jgi:hypothetical protein